MGELRLKAAKVFAPLLAPARYKGAHGGRGSGKSHFFGDLSVLEAYKNPGLRMVCIREVQKTLQQSAKRLIEDKIQDHGLGRDFNVLHDRIQTPGAGLIIFQGMQDHTAESIKSLEGFQRAWIEEAQTLSERSLTLLRPTIRAPASEIWASWNPGNKRDAIEFLRSAPPPNSVVVRANWRDNPWFGGEMEGERLYDLEHRPEKYDHVWEGGYSKITDGAYFAREMLHAEHSGRFKAEYDPALPVYTAWDLGVSDSTAIWFFQPQYGHRVAVLGYYENHGYAAQHYAEYVLELGRRNGWTYGKHHVPPDARAREWLTSGPDGKAKTRIQVLVELGLNVAVVREHKLHDGIEAARRMIDVAHFDGVTCDDGIECLRCYHREWDDDDKVFADRPAHDWSSHGADAFRYMAVAIGEMKPEPPKEKTEPKGIVDATWDEAMRTYGRRRRERV